MNSGNVQAIATVHNESATLILIYLLWFSTFIYKFEHRLNDFLTKTQTKNVKITP